MQRSTVVLLCFAAVLMGMIFGLFLGARACSSSNPYWAVVSSYLRLNVWHRAEALRLTRMAESLGLHFTFTSEAEFATITAGVAAVSSWVLGRVLLGSERVAVYAN